MDVRILDLDGSLTQQRSLLTAYRPPVIDLRSWGPAVRLSCSFGRFARFQKALADLLGGTCDEESHLTLYGSGDFHHVSLALLRRQTRPFNLLVIDNHPDWMRGIPLLHCGTWLWHAARLPQVRHVFHVGGDVDFDNGYRWLAPWSLLRSGRLTVFPAVRRYQRRPWTDVPTPPLRYRSDTVVGPERVAELLRPYRNQLARYPLYVSLDKDVMVPADALVNWDSGHLRLAEVRTLLAPFTAAAAGLAGMDIVGDWSPVRVSGLWRRLLHHVEHPRLDFPPAEAVRRNAQTNLALLRDLVPARTADVLVGGL